MNLSWKKTALAGTALLVIPLFHFLTHSDKEPASEGVEDPFVQETEQLIAELEQLGKDIPQSPPSSPVRDPNGPPPTDPQVERSSLAESPDEIPQAPGDEPQPKLVSDPKWKRELDQFLKGEASPREFLNSLNVGNWKRARETLALAYAERKLPLGGDFQKKFWMKVGEVGGKTVAEDLLKEGDPAFTKILKGWAKGSPQEMFDYYADLDLKSPQVQNYLEKTNSREIPLMDQFSSGMIDEVLRNSDGNVGNLQVENANDLIDHFLEKDKGKAESLTREFTERVILGRDKETLKQWVSSYKEPELQAGTAQRVIESGVFDKNPLEAVEFANSLESTKAKRSALSSAYARLAVGVNGHDPNVTATELNAMKDGWQRDFALNGFAHGLVLQDPDAAIEWANSISNEGFREVVTKNITKRINAEVLPDQNPPVTDKE